MNPAHAQGLYDPRHEHDACGLGFVVHIKGRKSHDIILQGLAILQNLDHRGAVGADPLMGDGAGILIQIPDALYREEMALQDVILPPPGEYGVGMVFLPREQASRLACEQELERKVRAEGQVVLGWRDVRVDADMPMSPAVKEREPVIRQIFIGRGPEVMVPDTLERKLYVIRKTASHAIRALGLKHGTEYFVPSMSTRTVVYKGLLLADQVGRYYRDLADPRATTALALVHQRFSTNTFPTWELAHPYRMIAHNGDLKTHRPRLHGHFHPVGSTDSEHAFCWIMQELAKSHAGVPSVPELTLTLRELAAKLAVHGTFNFLLSNGEALWAHASTHLHYIERRHPFASARLSDEDLSLDFATCTTPSDRVAVIATAPLTCNEQWTAFASGELLVFQDGQRCA